jgi:WhiB family redox-sensing transcriptional regulator
MIIILGLVILVAALVVGVAGVLGNGSSAHAVSHFSVLGYYVTGSPGTLFLSGIVVGAAGLLGGALPERVVMTTSEFAGGSPGWMPRGACRGEVPELFFPVSAAGPALAQVLAAKAVCFRCAVRAACLSYALATGQAGIWGGTTQEERHLMRRSSGSPVREHSGSPAITRAATDRHNYNAGQ